MVCGAVVTDSFVIVLQVVQLEMRVTLETAVSIKFDDFGKGEIAIE